MQQQSLYYSLVDAHISKLIKTRISSKEVIESIEDANLLFQKGNYEKAAKSYLDIASSNYDANNQKNIESFHVASYRYAISMARSYSTIENNINYSCVAEYYFAAIQIATQATSWIYSEAVSLQTCVENWFSCLCRSYDNGLGMDYSDSQGVDIIIKALQTSISPLHQLIALGLVRLHYVNPGIATEYEEKIFNNLNPNSINNLKKNLLHITKRDGTKLDERSPREKLFQHSVAGLSDAISKFFKGIQSFINTNYIDGIVTSRQSILEGLNLIMPYTQSPNGENRLCRETIRLIKEDLIGFKKARDSFSIQELTSINLHALQFEKDIEEHMSWIASCYLEPFVIHLNTLLKDDLESLGKKYVPSLSIETIKTHWPLSSSGNAINIELEIKNLGNAPANQVKVIVSVDKDSSQNAEVRDDHSLDLGNLSAGVTTHQTISLLIKEPSNFIYLECFLSWEDLGGVKDTLVSIKLLGQSKINWDEIKLMRPYSTKSKDQRDQLKGRDKILDTLFAGILATKSYFITGQRRVGKTSIARVIERELRQSGKAIVVYSPWGKIITGSGAKIPAQFFEYYCERIKSEAYSINPSITGLDAPSIEELAKNYSRAFENFILRFRSKFPDHKIAIMVDDLDEMPEAFYNSEDGNAFFTAIRAFLDEDFLSFVFIANEKLNSILQAQQGKLNLVITQQVDYLDRPSLNRLIKEPVYNILEFQDDAFDYIYELSAGNPYYATVLCERLFNDMVARRDYLVAKENVDDALKELVSSETAEGFVHFWSDGISTESLTERTRIKDETARILIALSQQKSDNSGFVQTNGFSELEILKFVEPINIDTRISNLVNRSVIESHPESPSKLKIHVPLFAEWLRISGPAKILDVQKVGTYLNPSTAKSIPDSEISPICSDLLYRGREIRPDQIREFLEQFGRIEDQKLILKLLKKLREQGFWSERRMRDAVRSMNDSINAKFKQYFYIKRPDQVDNLFLTCVPGAGKSGQIVLRQIRSEWTKLYNPNIDELSQISKSIRGFVRNRDNKGKKAIIAIVDDFVGTGRSATEELRKAIDQLLDEIHPYVDQCIIFYGILTGFESGINNIKLEFLDGEIEFFIHCHHILTENDRAFSEASRVFSNEDERMAARDLCRMAGQSLYTEWPLGFGDCQALVVFNNSVPNDSLPILWQQGRHWRGHGMWKPLFPRHAVDDEI